MYLEIITANSGKELKENFDNFLTNKYQPQIGQYTGAKSVKVLNTQTVSNNKGEFIMTVNYDYKKHPAI